MRKCPVCKERYEPKFNSMEPCSKYECRLALYNKTIEKVLKQKDKVLKDKTVKWDVKLQSKMQEIARVIDTGQLCLAKNKTAGQMHGGHVLSRGGNGNMRFNIHNIFSQSAQSNHFQSDDVLMREGIIREFGQGYLNFIIGLKATPIMKYSNEEYQDFYKKACKLCNTLKGLGIIKFHPKSRIDYRNRVMSELGIYPAEYCVFTF